MIQSVIYNRQNLIQFYNNTFDYEILNVENTENKNWNKKQRLETSTLPSIKYLLTDYWYKTSKYNFIVHQVKTANWSSGRL
jgi:hypothetical protein